jgi:hypothetical protein
VGAEAHRDRACGGVGHHHRDEVRRDRPVAALQPAAALRLERHEPADAGADEDAEALGLDDLLAVQPGLARRLRRGGDRELREAVGAAGILRAHLVLGVEGRAGADRVLDARALGQQGAEERLGALADRRDDAAARDDDVVCDSSGGSGHARAPSRSPTSSCTRATASPTVAIAFRRPSAIWIS